MIHDCIYSAVTVEDTYDGDILKALSMDINIWKSLFDHVIDPIIGHTYNLLNRKEMNGCKYLLLAGGLSASPYYQKKIIQAFGRKLKVIATAKPLSSVAAGAAYFGTEKIIPSYKARPKLTNVIFLKQYRHIKLATILRWVSTYVFGSSAQAYLLIFSS